MCVAEDDRAGARQRDHLPDGAAVQHDDQQDAATGEATAERRGRELVDQAPLGGRGVRGVRARRLHRRLGVRRRQEPATKFVYRDRLWQGADMVGLGVASFGHMSGVHMQNLDQFGAYCESIDARTSCRWRAACNPRPRSG